jgi:hypothetical protein
MEQNLQFTGYEIMRNLNSLYNECKNCNHRLKEHCIIKYHDTIPKQCPCIICIVKSMCKLEIACTDRNKLFVGIPKLELNCLLRYHN